MASHVPGVSFRRVAFRLAKGLHQLSHALFATTASACVTRSQPRSAKGSGSAGPCRSAIGPKRCDDPNHRPAYRCIEAAGRDRNRRLGWSADLRQPADRLGFRRHDPARRRQRLDAARNGRDRTPCLCADELPGFERRGKGRRGRWSPFRMPPARGRQLDGIFWIYRLSRLKRDRAVKRFDKTQRTQASGD